MGICHYICGIKTVVICGYLLFYGNIYSGDYVEYLITVLEIQILRSAPFCPISYTALHVCVSCVDHVS